MKNTILKIGFIAALLVRFFTPSLLRFDSKNHLRASLPVHFSDGRMVVQVEKRSAFLNSGFVIVDLEKGGLHFLPVRSGCNTSSLLTNCSFNRPYNNTASVISEASLVHFNLNAHIPVIGKPNVRNIRDKIVDRIKKDLGIRSKPSKKDCEKLDED